MAYSKPEICAAARRMLPELAHPLRGEIEALLARAEQGEDTHLEILERLTAEEAYRQRLRDLLKASREVPLGFEPLPGEPCVPASVRYICPVEGCGFTWQLQQKGERPPRCPRHHVELVPAPEGEKAS